MPPGTWSLLLVVSHLILVAALAWLNALVGDLRSQATSVLSLRDATAARTFRVVRSRENFIGSAGLARFERYIVEAARWHRVDPALVKAIILAESAGDPLAVSPRNARGLMQLLPSTGREMGARRSQDLFDPRTNIFLGTKYLSQLLVEFNGDVARALAAYNAGPGLLYDGRLLPAETRAYVPRVLRLWAQLRKSRLPAVS